MEYIKKEELIIGEIYKSTLYNHIFKYLDKNGDKNPNISKTYNMFNKDLATIGNGLANIINTTSEEKHWLNEAIRLDKFITFEEAMKTFIPEYVEAVSNKHSSSEIIGTIYKTSELPKWVQKHKLEEYWKAYMFHYKPSTKEAYDAQFVVKEPEFILPNSWCIKVTEENRSLINKLRRKKRIGCKNPIKYDYLSSKDFAGTSFVLGTEITFEQFKKYVLKEEIVVEEVIEQPITENKTELEIWLENTKSLNLSLEDLEKYIGSGQTCNYYNIYTKLEGNYSKGRAKILFDKWNNKIIEPLPQFKIIESIETITKVENNEGNQFFIGDVVISSNGTIQTIESFDYNKAKTNIIAFTNKQSILGNGIGIDKIEHYIEPKVEETLLEKAKRLYPIGTKFKDARGGRNLYNVTPISQFRENSDGAICIQNNGNGTIYFNNEWAEIIE